MIAKRIFALILALAGFWAGNRISFQVRSTWPQGPHYVLDHALDGLTTNPLWVSTETIDLAIGLGVIAVMGLTWAYNSVGKLSKRHGEEHGSAQWAKASQIKPFMDKNPANQLLFTRTEALSLDSRKTVTIPLPGSQRTPRSTGFAI